MRSVNAARRLRRAFGPAQSVAIWDVNQIQPDDVMLWMDESGHERKHPGHIAVVYKRVEQVLFCAESNGENDGAGHSGPRFTKRPLRRIIGGHRH
jgi:hypothetical protein